MISRTRVFEIVEVAAPGDTLSKCFDVAIMLLILLNVVVFLAESVEALAVKWETFFHWFEVFSVTVFTVEYLSRLWSCTASSEYRKPLVGRLRFAARPLLVVDLAVILPFYIPFFGVDLRVIRAVRLLRILRLGKLGRYSESLQMVQRVLKSKKEELLITVFIGALLLVLSSSLMYFAEREAQPEKFSSIPRAMWWAVTTLTTVGYGDVVPITPLGRVVASFVSLLCVGMFALPTAILGSGFIEEIRVKRDKGITCPHCGEKIHRAESAYVHDPDDANQ